MLLLRPITKKEINLKRKLCQIPTTLSSNVLHPRAQVPWMCSTSLLAQVGNQIMISYIGANKHHRQRKFVRRSTKRSVVQSTCKLSRGWMMRSELRRSRAGWESRFSDDGPEIFEGTRADHDIKKSW